MANSTSVWPYLRTERIAGLLLRNPNIAVTRTFLYANSFPFLTDGLYAFTLMSCVSSGDMSFWGGQNFDWMTFWDFEWTEWARRGVCDLRRREVTLLRLQWLKVWAKSRFQVTPWRLPCDSKTTEYATQKTEYRRRDRSGGTKGVTPCTKGHSRRWKEKKKLKGRGTRGRFLTVYVKWWDETEILDKMERTGISRNKIKSWRRTIKTCLIGTINHCLDGQLVGGR